MKYIKQLLIIICISLMGEWLKSIIPLPVPASIYGMLILFGCLMTGLIKLEQVRDTGKYLIEIMPLMFIPAAVGLIDSWEVLKSMLVPVCVVTVVTLVTVMAATGRISQRIIRKNGEKHE